MLRVLVLVLVTLIGCAPQEPLPSDLAAVVDAVRRDMTTALPRLADCVDTAHVSHAWELDDRAEYRRDTRTVVVRVPATEPQLRVSLVHELAHHVDLGCNEAPRRDFLRTQGFRPDAAWESGRNWEETPSEQFAIAVALVVTGSNDPLRPVTIEDETIELIMEWGGAPGAPS